MRHAVSLKPHTDLSVAEIILKQRNFVPVPVARGLRRRYTAAHLLRLWVRIPPGTWVSVVSVVCCQVEVSATS